MTSEFGECGEIPQLCRNGKSPNPISLFERKSIEHMLLSESRGAFFMENRAYIPEEAYQSYIRAVPTSEELEQSGVINFEQKKAEMSKKKIVQYEVDFDREQARTLVSSRGGEDFENRVESFKSFTEMQLATALGERFNRGLSRYSYKNKEGVLYGEHSDEPFINVLERGRAYRKTHGNPIDHARENAEVVGFSKMEEQMRDASVGTTMISISQPGQKGSIYKHNFYDAFRKKEDGNIEVVRFSNAHDAKGTLHKLQELDSNIIIPDDTSDVSLLSNPIIISPEIAKDMTLDEIHSHIHQDHTIMNEEDFRVVREMCAFLIVSYIHALLDDPEDRDTHARLYNALLNKADEIADALKTGEITFVQSSSAMTRNEMYYLGEQEVREVDTGCGFSGGINFESALGTYSVAQYGLRPGEQVVDSLGNRLFDCPDCKKTNLRPYNGMIERCQHCFSTAVSCKPEEDKVKSLDKYRKDKERSQVDKKKAA